MASTTKLVIILSALSLLHLHLPFSAAQTAAVNGGYWFPESGFLASDIDSTLFTHLYCAFAVLNPQTNQVYVLSSNNASFAQFTNTVKIKNPSVKTLVSIGGGTANKTGFAVMAASATSRKSFIDSSIKLARDYGFSGLDLSWLHPDTSSDMTNLGALFTEWLQAITAEAGRSGKAALLLTAAVFYSSNMNEINYPARTINSTLDWINVLAYDFYTPSTYDYTRTNSHAMLYNPPSQVFSGSYGIGTWIQAGVSAKKLVLAIPFYGYAWRLADAQNHSLLAPSTGSDGPEDGAMRYSQIRSFIRQYTAPVVYNSTIVGNYCYSGTTWIGYDDVEAVDAKVSYAKERRLLGYFAWHVGGDYNWVLSQQAKNSWEVIKEGGQMCYNEDYVASKPNIVCYNDACVVSVM